MSKQVLGHFNNMVPLIFVLAALTGLAYWFFRLQRGQSRPPRPAGRFNYSERRYRRRLLAQSRRDYPGQSESWHLRQVERLLQQKQSQW
ncbi:hypothetical protein K9N68_39740 (plasmid) [Kovacikia minuta CCNUW1]|uniref:hypothetical protein n=1 Tax=Kovacikia minuta TaxID=2931930 RepID=UPI001CCEA82B|nr:hypothetical protein [Kovacikia minuta]UBF30788.1 hypothetical protein K9N68_39740 [Kovacikia minuta CCNUW1]